MKENKSHLFLEGSQYFYWLVGLNIIFFFSNLPILAGLLFLQLHPANSLYFYILLLALGTSLQALFSCFGKLKKEKDLSVFKDYCSFYKKNFRKSLAVWFSLSLVVYIIILNINFLAGTSFLVLMFPLYLILVMLFISALVCGLFIVSRDEATKIIDVLKYAFYLSVKRLHITIFNVILFSMWLFVIFLRPVLGLGIMPSVIVFIMAKNNEFVCS